MKTCGPTFIRKTLEAARKLTILAAEGEMNGMDDGCAVLSGIMRDCAYKIRTRAEQENDLHKVLGMRES